MKNNEPRTISVFNYEAYETDTSLFDNDVLEKITTVSYDNNLDYVVKINRVLRTESQNVIEVPESPEDHHSQESLAASQQTVICSSGSQITESESPVRAHGSPAAMPKCTKEVATDNILVASKVLEESVVQKVAKKVNEWEEDSVLDSSTFVSFSPIREKVQPPAQKPQSAFKIVAVQSLARENSEVDRRIEALVSLYKKKMKKKTQELDYHFQPYQKQSSSHPSFHEQWKVFYIKQNFAIVSSGATDFNYRPAWNVYWSRYLQKVKNQELESYESRLRIDLNIPESVPFTTKLDFQDLSDISEDELDFQSPVKRRRADIGQETAAKVFNDHDRMIIAYRLAYEHFRENKQLSPDQLSSLVSEYCAQQTASSQHLTDNDILVLYKKFNNLSPNEQANLISFVRSIELTDKVRYLKLAYNLKMQENNS